MKYQENPPKTLTDYMGIKDTDIQEPEHDDICLKLIDEKILKKIFLDKIYKEELKDDVYTTKFDILKLTNSYDDGYFYRISNNGYVSSSYTIKDTLKTPTIYRKSKLDIINSKIGHVVVKRGSNWFSQRLGFVDVFCRLSVVKIWEIKDENKFHQLDYEEKQYGIFFKVKTSKPSISIVSRDIEFFRDALKEIEKVDVTPFYVGHSKLPVKQFESITIDEILKMERELE